MKLYVGRPYYSDTLGIDDPDGVIRGIYVGSCIHERNSLRIWEGSGSHAHNFSKTEFYGWICILDPKDIITPAGKMTSRLAHEVAHLLNPDQHHTRNWKRTITKMGYPLEVARCHLKPL